MDAEESVSNEFGLIKTDIWKNNLWINNYCGNKLLSKMTDVMHPFVADKRSPLCEPWAFDEQQSKTVSSDTKGKVTCVA